MKDEIKEVITVLFHAALLGRADIIKNAINSLQNNGNADSKDISKIVSFCRVEDKATPLHIASLHGHADAVRTLINAGADLSICPSSGEFAGKRPYEAANEAVRAVYEVMLCEKIAVGDSQTVLCLLDGGVALGEGLHWASAFGREELARLLLSRGADPHLPDANGHSSLYLAVKHRQPQVVRLLLEEGGKIQQDEEEVIRNLLPAESTDSKVLEIRELLDHPPPPSLHSLRSQYLSSLQDQDGVDGTLAATAEVAAEVDDRDESSATDQLNRLLVFWPPVRRQVRESSSWMGDGDAGLRLKDKQAISVGGNGLILRTDQNLVVCLANNEIDAFPVLNWSGFLDCMEIYGFEVQVRPRAEAAIRLVVDSHVCPLPQSYRLSCTARELSVIAADYSGLLYGMQTVVQIIQLHGVLEVVHGAAAIVGEEGQHRTVKQLTLPSLHLLDYPQTPQRAVLWSFQQQVRTQSQWLRETVELMGRLRLNMLLLLIDPVLPDEEEEEEEDRVLGGSNGRLQAVTERLSSLDEDCRRRCVELVPTCRLSHPDERLPLTLLKAFSQSMITLMLDYDDISGRTENADYVEQCRLASKKVLREAQLAGFSTVQIVISPWFSRKISFHELSHQVGITLIRREPSFLLPPLLLNKPLVACHDFVHGLGQYMEELHASLAQCSIFPALLEKDFCCPSLIIKYYLFMYAGAAWNGEAFQDIVGDQSALAFYSTLLADLLRLLVYPSHRLVSPSAIQATLFYLTADWTRLSDAVMENREPQDSNRLSCRDLAQQERLIWSIVTMPSEKVHKAPLTLSKPSLTLVLKYYRHLLTLADWKVNRLREKAGSDSFFMQFFGLSSSSRSNSDGRDVEEEEGRSSCILAIELEEFFTIINLLSTACKTILHGMNAVQKHGKETLTSSSIVTTSSLQSLMSPLSIGGKSDSANILLEALSCLPLLWRKRFDHGLEDALLASMVALPDVPVHLQNNHRDTHHSLLPSSLFIPSMALLQTLCDGISSVHTCIERVFH